jgi:hypothetical protein
LKSKFGGGSYQLELRCNVKFAAQCLELCMSVLPPNSVLDECLGGYFRINALRVDEALPPPSSHPSVGASDSPSVDRELNLAHIFDVLEAHKVQYEIYDYSISQCTLEQIFLKMARSQESSH